MASSKAFCLEHSQPFFYLLGEESLPLPPSRPGFKGAAERLLQLSQRGGPEADVQGPGGAAGG